MKTRLWFSLLLAPAVIGSSLAASAQAALPSKTGVLSMTPAKRTLIARPPVTLSPTRVANTTQLNMKVRVFPAFLTQALSGTFGIKESPSDLAAARLVFPVGPQAFPMKPGDVTHIQLKWNLVPRGQKAVYLGLVVQGTPQLPQGKSLGQVLRLLGTNFFVLPGHHVITGQLTRLVGQQAAPHVIQFLPRVHNSGQVHSQPRGGLCTIVDSSGAVRFKQSFGGAAGIVLPGYSREYPVVLRKPLLPAGQYRMKCAMHFGKKRSTITYPFRLTAPNTLPTADLKLNTVRASGEVGAAADVKVVMQNNGTKASPAVLEVSLSQTSPGAPHVVARIRSPQGAIGAGQQKSASLSLGKLEKASYQVKVILSDGTTDLDELTANFTASPHRGFVKRVTDWLKDHLGLLIALLALLALLIFVVLWRRQKRKHEDELAAARAGVPPQPPLAAPAVVAEPAPEPEPAPAAAAPAGPAAPASDGRININTASVDELIQLPGIGPRAAERLIAHREEYGSFRSVNELIEVDGFDAQRIKRIGDAAEV
jgi:competence ComEA-like helix-hairpin-helix protein